MNKNILTNTQAQLLKQTSKVLKRHFVGELYPEIFDCDNKINISNLKLNVAIIYVGAYELNTNAFPKIKCPICGKEESLVPYYCGASILSGNHVIKFYCSNCSEKIAMNDNKYYYHLIRDYVLENSNNLKTSTHFLNCTKIKNSEFIIN